MRPGRTFVRSLTLPPTLYGGVDMETRMIDGSDSVDFKKRRDMGRSLIGKEVRFKAVGYDAVRGKHVETGEVSTGIVQGWDDVTGCLTVQVEGDHRLISVNMANLVE